MEQISFLRQFLRNPRSVGAIAPSSRKLGEEILAAADIEDRATVVEFGPGTGAFTSLIHERLQPGQRYIGIEKNQRFATFLAERFPDMTFVCESVENLDSIAAREGITSIDAIICGLPWASLPLIVQDGTFEAMRSLLPPDAVFCTFAYLQGLLLPGASSLRRRLNKEFDKVTRSSVVWLNIPPAFFYVCRR